MKPIGKRNALTLAYILAQLWMLRQPTEDDVAGIVIQVNDLLGEEFAEAVIDFVQLEDKEFPIRGISYKYKHLIEEKGSNTDVRDT